MNFVHTEFVIFKLLSMCSQSVENQRNLYGQKNQMKTLWLDNREKPPNNRQILKPRQSIVFQTILISHVLY